MDTSKTRVLLPTLFCVMIVVSMMALSPAVPAVVAPVQYDAQSESSGQFKDYIYITPMHDGVPVGPTQVVENVVTNIGLDWIEQQLAGTMNTTAQPIYIALSNDNSSLAPDGTWTQLPAEITASGLGKALATYTGTGTGAWKLEKIFTSGADGIGNITQVGLFWDSVASHNNVMYAVGTIAGVNLMTSDQLNITWTHSVANS